jgi:glycosyltransferase involved in cell wall biosynthesis
MANKKVTLCMIVKNESQVIERCLASVLPIIDHWVIVDTGSTDGTQDKIKKFFDNVGIPGELHERPWKNFGHNRSEALELARNSGKDYSLMIDADEILVFDPGFDPDQFKQALTADLYNVFAIYGQTKYHRPQLTSNKKNFYYRGILHEYVDCHDPIETRDFAKGFINTPIQDGNRSKSADKYAKDAEVFEKVLASGNVEEKDFNRYHFYLAQSYRDSQQWEKSLEAYLKRASLGGWNEEVFYSYYQAARIMEILKKEFDEIIRMYFQAYQVAPWRAESLWAAARLCRNYCRWDQAYRFAKQALKIRYPEGALFVGQGIYEWAIGRGLAKEQARAILPEGLTVTRLYMSGTLRSWIHYCDLRMENGTQKEHREVANECWKEICKEFPAVMKAIDNIKQLEKISGGT